MVIYTIPFFPSAFPSSLYSTNHQGFVVVSGIAVVVVEMDVVVVILIGTNSSENKDDGRAIFVSLVLVIASGGRKALACTASSNEKGLGEEKIQLLLPLAYWKLGRQISIHNSW